MLQTNEALLGAWLRLSTSINNSRLVTDLPYNESLICNVLYRTELTSPDKLLTATELCAETKILKSQMNRILEQMEEKALIFRERSPEDKRKIFIRLNHDQNTAYFKQHQKILAIMDSVIEKLGEGKSRIVVRTLNDISDVADELFQ